MNAIKLNGRAPRNYKQALTALRDLGCFVDTEGDFVTAIAQVTLPPGKQWVSDEYLHLRNIAEKQDALDACREGWRPCPEGCFCGWDQPKA